MVDMKAAICIAAAVSLIHVVSAADYTIGSAAGGWGGEYKAWVASQTFSPGDTLSKCTKLHTNYCNFYQLVRSLGLQ